MLSSKKFICEGTLSAGVYLSEASSPPMTPIPLLTHCIRVYSTLIHTGKEGGGGGLELTREQVRGAAVNKAG